MPTTTGVRMHNTNESDRNGGKNETKWGLEINKD